MGERLEITDQQLDKLIRKVCDKVNENTDAHTAEAIEAISIHIEKRYNEHFEHFKTETTTAINCQNQRIEFLSTDLIDVHRDINNINKRINGQDVIYIPRAIVKLAVLIVAIAIVFLSIFKLSKLF